MSEHEEKAFLPASFWKIALSLMCLGFLIWLFIPNFDNRMVTSASNACINNLRQIDAAANQFALEHNLTNGDAIRSPDDLTNYIKLNSVGKIPPCPSGGIYSIKKAGDVPTGSLGTNVPQAHVLP